EAAVRVIHLAFAFRRMFHKDVVVDLFCYRRYGHNEADEPAFTQPRMYELIDAHPSVRAIYTEQLLHRGEITTEDERQLDADFRARLDAAFAETRAPAPAPPDDELALPAVSGEQESVTESVTTTVDDDALEVVVDALTRLPEGFAVNPK